MAFTEIPAYAPVINLPAPVTTGTGIQSFTDVLGDVWVAKAGVNNGNWKRAKDAIIGKIWRNAAFTVPTANAWGIFPFDTVNDDVYGCFTLGANAAFTCPIPGRYLVNCRVDYSATAGIRGLVSIYRSGVETARGNDLVSGYTNPLAVTASDIVVASTGDTLQTYFYCSGAVGCYAGSLYECRMSVQLVGT